MIERTSLACLVAVAILVFPDLSAGRRNDEVDTVSIMTSDENENEQPPILYRLMQELIDMNLLAFVVFTSVVLGAFEILDYLVKNCNKKERIPVRGKHLDVLRPIDILFITLSKLSLPPFMYCYVRYAYFSSGIEWSLANITLWNLILPLPFLYIVYDFTYTLVHWALHIQWIYPYIHKHHHVQKAPSRANIDAINVHPIEFFVGEYNHLFALHICSAYVVGFFLPSIHIFGALLFLALGGILTALNHTRYDVSLPFVFANHSFIIYDSKFHDVHHRIPQSNYGQYTMFWDVIFGTFRPYNPQDRINPKFQINPETGKSFEYTTRTK